MTRFVRLLGCAAALFIGLGAVSAEAQTVIVRNAPAAATVEIAFDQTAAGTGTVSAAGDTTVRLTAFPVTGPEVAAAVHLDVCGTTLRVRLASRAIEAPVPGPGCERRSVPGYFVIRSVSTLVMDVSTSVPMVRLAQGRPPEAWLRDGPLRAAREMPTGLIAFGGGGIGRIPNAVDLMCGNDTRCKREDTKLTYGVGAELWVTRFVGLEAGFIKPRRLVALNDFETDPYTSTINARVLTLAALGGYPLGPARFYGRVGANYHRATFRTVQVTNATSIVVDGVNQTFPATTQTFLYDTVGWGLLFGGGVEGWLSPTTAIFADVTVFDLKGENTDTRGTRITDDRGSAFLVGLKIRITGR
jgi:hypothetical protein